jgi:L-fuculose-phosphate aldolase
MLMLARGLGKVNYFSEPEAKALLDLKSQWGFADPRNELKNCDICANDVFRESWQQAGVQQQAFQPPSYPAPAAGNGKPALPDGDVEQLVQQITDRVMAQLKS